MTVLIDLIAGARPNFMKIAPNMRAMESRNSQDGALRSARAQRAALEKQ